MFELLKYLKFKIRVLIPLFIFCNIFSQSNIGVEVKYDCKILRDTLDRSTFREDSMLLIVNNDSSLYKSEKKFIRDSIILAKIMNHTSGKVLEFPKSMPRGISKDEVYREGDRVEMYLYISGNYYAFEPPKKMNWKLQDGQKKIGPYTCHKAQTKYGDRLVTAWYTTEIPIPDGPYTFKGLPGLILEVYDKNHYFDFKMVSVANRSREIKPLERSVVYTTYDKYLKKRNEFINDPTALVRQKGFKVSKELEERRIQQLKSYNNHLD